MIPTGVDVDYFHPLPVEEISDSLVFTGSMDWLPNEDAILYFVDAILPFIKQQIASSVRRGGRPKSFPQAAGPSQKRKRAFDSPDGWKTYGRSSHAARFALSLCGSVEALVSRSSRPWR